MAPGRHLWTSGKWIIQQRLTTKVSGFKLGLERCCVFSLVNFSSTDKINVFTYIYIGLFKSFPDGPDRFRRYLSSTDKGNGATLKKICSGGRPLSCRGSAWTAVSDRRTALTHLSQNKNHVNQTARSFSNNHQSTQMSLCLFYESSSCPLCSITWVNMDVLNPCMWVKS